jgi:hypothetical protein
MHNDLGSQTNLQTHIVLMAFLAACFSQMADALESFKRKGVTDLRGEWHRHMEPISGEDRMPTREAFYAAVLTRMEEVR